MKYLVVVAILSSAALFSCSHDDSDPNQDARNLAQQDHDTLASSVGGIELLDTSIKDSINQLFGGATGPAFQKFMDERIHYFITDDEYEALQLKIFNARFASSKDAKPDASSGQTATVQVGGQNVGTILWLEAAEHDVKNSHFNFRDKALTLDSGRVGLMLIGEAYHRSVKIHGEAYFYPAGYRQMILIHEARHSDCPKGLSTDDIKYLKSKSNSTYKEIISSYQNMTCGYLHSICPASHELAGYAACDSMPWGAYTSGALFSVLNEKSVTDPRDKQIISMVAADQLSRLLFSIDDMYSGKLGSPDLTNQGLVGP